MLPELLPASLLRQYLFCPRVPWHMRNGTPVPEPMWVRQGTEHHLRQRRLTRTRKLARLGLDTAERCFEISLSDDELGIQGVVDLLLVERHEVVPVEFKLQDAPPTTAIQLQLIAYGLMAEKVFDRPFRRGLVISGSRTRTYPVKRSRSLERRCRKVIDNLRYDLGAPFLPPSSAQLNKCTQCEYLPRCNDRY